MLLLTSHALGWSSTTTPRIAHRRASPPKLAEFGEGSLEELRVGGLEAGIPCTRPAIWSVTKVLARRQRLDHLRSEASHHTCAEFGQLIGSLGPRPRGGHGEPRRGRWQRTLTAVQRAGDEEVAQGMCEDSHSATAAFRKGGGGGGGVQE